MKFIYVDEAGTSDKEPVTIVAAITVDADSQWRAAEAEIRKMFLQIPQQYSDGFVFHAKSIWGDKRLRDGWNLDERVKFLTGMMELPRKLNMAVSFCMVRRAAEQIANMPRDLSHAQLQHAMAFAQCIASADHQIAVSGPKNEVATVVAEDVHDMRDFLKRVVNGVKRNPILLQEQHLRLTLKEILSGQTSQNRQVAVSKVIDEVHFVAKAGAPLLQLADACAFGLRRYFAEQTRGEEFANAILGRTLNLADWSGPCSFATFGGKTR